MTMPLARRRVRFLLLSAFLSALAAGYVSAQQRQSSSMPAPRIWQVSPAGGKAGSTFEIAVAGKHLDDAEKLVFSTPGVTAVAVPAPPPEIDPKTKKPKAGMAAPPADVFKFKVTVPPGTPLGHHDVRLVNKHGVSNARTFVVGDLPEIDEKEPNNDVEQAQKIDLNSTVNGSIANAADVDYYKFAAKKGQRVVVSCLATSIDSRVQPALEVYDSADNRLAENRTYSGYDALTDFVAPADGDYLVRVIQFTHTLRPAIQGTTMPAGSSDHFYRLTVSTLPWIDAVFPSVVEPGKATTVTVYGRNLPGGKPDPAAVVDDSVLESMTLSVTAPADAVGKLTATGYVAPPAGMHDGFEVRVKNAVGSSNPYMLGVARAPVVVDNGSNETPDAAQVVAPPCEIAGRVEKRRDRDWYAFTAKKGDVWKIEIISNRLGAPTYMTMAVQQVGAKGEMYESPLNDNTERVSRKFWSRSEDPPAYRFVAPADGRYELLVASRAGDTLFGPRHTYSVRIAREEADFRLVAMGGSDISPDASIVSAGGADAFTVVADRIGDFAGDIELTVEGLPAGVTCAPQAIGGSTRKTTLVLQGAATLADFAGEVRIKGTAVVNGKAITREARPAGVIWPVSQNDGQTPAIARVERSLWLATRGKAVFVMKPTIDRAQITQGDKASIKVKVDRFGDLVKGPISIGLMQMQNSPNLELPQNLRVGNNNQPTNLAAGQAEVTLPVTTTADVPPGVYNVVLRGQTSVTLPKDPKKPGNAQPSVIVQPSLAVRLEVLPKSLATVTAANTNPTVKAGGQTEVVVRVTRKFGYAGEYKVALVLPAGAKGVEAKEVVIPAGSDEAKVVFTSPPGTMPGGRANLVVRATAMYNGKTAVADETKINVTVVK